MASQRRHGELMRDAQSLLDGARRKAVEAGIEAYALGYDRGGACNWSATLQAGWLQGFDAAAEREAAMLGAGGFLSRSLPPGDRDDAGGIGDG